MGSIVSYIFDPESAYIKNSEGKEHLKDSIYEKSVEIKDGETNDCAKKNKMPANVLDGSGVPVMDMDGRIRVIKRERTDAELRKEDDGKRYADMFIKDAIDPGKGRH
eukprot:CAMPEP_0116033878 /NCGR_PEP_ID=MMETSP0321-20121206/19259_1 /TAXON_ID=163516 /ORGANISM="Leptocylindrus danicus var. danicus, Strain B650" /LENGTH=106 /DNA_ID=CAMNT_0003510053 /DNA_START=49 /DNA_END=369 /DNA_ORIENTATION=+